MILSEMTTSDFEKALPEGETKLLRKIYTLMGVGLVAEIVLLLGLYLTGHSKRTPIGTNPIQWLTILTGIHIAFAVVWCGFGYKIFRGCFENSVLSWNFENGIKAREALATQLKKAFLIRITFLGAVAFVGLLVCLIGLFSGAINAQPVYWINSLPAFISLVVIYRTFPSHENLLSFFINNVLIGPHEGNTSAFFSLHILNSIQLAICVFAGTVLLHGNTVGLLLMGLSGIMTRGLVMRRNIARSIFLAFSIACVVIIMIAATSFIYSHGADPKSTAFYTLNLGFFAWAIYVLRRPEIVVAFKRGRPLGV